MSIPPLIPPSGNFSTLFVSNAKISNIVIADVYIADAIILDAAITDATITDATITDATITNATIGNATMTPTNLGFFGDSTTQQNANNVTVQSVVELLQAYGLCSGPPWIQQGSKLVGTGATGIAYQGIVTMSSDGNTIAVGGQSDDSNIGAVWVYTLNAGVWSQQGSKLVGTGYAGPGAPRQGSSVSLSSDGNTLAFGGPEDESAVGSTWVFTRTAGVWSQQGSKLVGTGYTGLSSGQGSSVSLSSDGNTLAVGAYGDDTNIGATWVFTRTAGVWSQQGSKLVGTGYTGVSAQGASVALSSDGDTLAVGGPSDNTNIGAIWIFTRTAGVWSQQTKLLGSGYVGISAQGSSVSLSSDGNILASGGVVDNSSVGAVWIFTRVGLVWYQFYNKLVGLYHSQYSTMGSSVKLSLDGRTLVFGGYAEKDNLGGAWVFQYNNSVSDPVGSWNQVGFRLIPDDYTIILGELPLYFGQQGIGLSGDGTSMVVGSLNNGNPVTGSAWVFVRSP